MFKSKDLWFLSPRAFQRPNLCLAEGDGGGEGAPGSFGSLPNVPTTPPAGWTPPAPDPTTANAVKEAAAKQSLGSLNDQMKREGEAPGLTPDPVVESKFAKYHEPTLVTVADIFVPYFQGAVDAAETIQRIMTTDKGLGSQLFYGYLDRYAETPTFVNILKENYPGLVKQLAPPAQPASAAAPAQPASPQAAEVPIDPLTGETDPAYLRLEERVKAAEARAAQAEKQAQQFIAEAKQLTAQQTEEKLNQAVTEVETKAISTQVRKSIQVDQLTPFQNRALVSVIGNAMDADNQLHSYEADYKRHQLEGNAYQASVAKGKIEQRITDLVERELKEYIGDLKANNSALLEKVRAQSPGALRQPNPGQGVSPGFNPNNLVPPQGGYPQGQRPNGAGQPQRLGSLTDQLRREGVI